jgi:hypothetical protein
MKECDIANGILTQRYKKLFSRIENYLNSFSNILISNNIDYNDKKSFKLHFERDYYVGDVTLSIDELQISEVFSEIRKCIESQAEKISNGDRLFLKIIEQDTKLEKDFYTKEIVVCSLIFNIGPDVRDF